MTSTTHITLHTPPGSTVTLPVYSITVQHYKGQTWVGPIGDHSDPSIEVVESPAEIRALIEAAETEKWRREIAANVISGTSLLGSAPVDILAVEALRYADAVIATDKARKP